MTVSHQPLPEEPHVKAAINGVAPELSVEAMYSLTGYFDVLIQMDFAIKHRNQGQKHGSKITTTNKRGIGRVLQNGSLRGRPKGHSSGQGKKGKGSQ